MGIVQGESDHTGLSAWAQVLRRCSDDGSDLAASVIPSVIAWHQYLTHQTEKTLQGRSTSRGWSYETADLRRQLHGSHRPGTKRWGGDRCGRNDSRRLGYWRLPRWQDTPRADREFRGRLRGSGPALHARRSFCEEWTDGGRTSLECHVRVRLPQRPTDPTAGCDLPV